MEKPFSELSIRLSHKTCHRFGDTITIGVRKEITKDAQFLRERRTERSDEIAFPARISRRREYAYCPRRWNCFSATPSTNIFEGTRIFAPRYRFSSYIEHILFPSRTSLASIRQSNDLELRNCSI